MKTSKRKLDDFFSEARDHIQPPTREQMAGRVAAAPAARKLHRYLIGIVSAAFGAFLLVYLVDFDGSNQTDPQVDNVEYAADGMFDYDTTINAFDSYPDHPHWAAGALDTAPGYSQMVGYTAEVSGNKPSDADTNAWEDAALDQQAPKTRLRLAVGGVSGGTAAGVLNNAKVNLKLQTSELAALGLVEQECGLHFFRRVDVDLSDEMVLQKWIGSGLSPDEPFYINKTVVEYLSVGSDKTDKPYPSRELTEGPKPLLVMAAQAGSVYGPTMHFDSRGKQLNRIRMERDGYELEDGISLGSGLVVAVQVPMKCSTTYFTVVLWYELNNELIAHLPRRFHPELEHLLVNTATSADEAPALQGDDHYSASAESANAIENARVFPNPASNEATLEYESRVSTYLMIGLYNMQGGLEREIFSGNIDPGKRDLDLDLSGVANGMYTIRFQGGSRAPTTLNLVVRH